MPRYAIKPTWSISVLYVDAQDTIEAVHDARRTPLELARSGNLEITRTRDTPYDEGDARSDARYEETEGDRDHDELHARRLQGVLSPSEATE